MTRKIKYKIPLLTIEKTIGDPVFATAASMTEFAKQHSERYKRLTAGDELRDRVAMFEKLALECFATHRVRYFVSKRSQIISEYEDPKFDLWSDQRMATHVELLKRVEGKDFSRPLRKREISAQLYCAAQILNAVNVVRIAAARESVNAFELAYWAMNLGEWAMKYVFSEGYEARHSSAAARRSRTSARQSRVNALKVRHKVSPIDAGQYAEIERAYKVSRKTLLRDLDAAGIPR